MQKFVLWSPDGFAPQSSPCSLVGCSSFFLFTFGLPLCRVINLSISGVGERGVVPLHLTLTVYDTWVIMIGSRPSRVAVKLRGVSPPACTLDTLVSISVTAELLINASLVTKQGKPVPVAAVCLLPLAGQLLILMLVCPVWGLGLSPYLFSSHLFLYLAFAVPHWDFSRSSQPAFWLVTQAFLPKRLFCSFTG